VPPAGTRPTEGSQIAVSDTGAMHHKSRPIEIVAVDAFVERMTETGVATSASFVGCTDSEIAALESK